MHDARCEVQAWHAHLMSPWLYRGMFEQSSSSCGGSSTSRGLDLLFDHDDSVGTDDNRQARAEGFTAARKLWQEEVLPSQPHLLPLDCSPGVLNKGISVFRRCGHKLGSHKVASHMHESYLALICTSSPTCLPPLPCISWAITKRLALPCTSG